MRCDRHCSSAGFAGASSSGGEVRKGGAAPLRVPTRFNPRVADVPSTKGTL